MAEAGTVVARSCLVIGGARSGKSTHAEALAAASGGMLVYLATATVWDDEMDRRVAEHRARRDGRWRTVEAPLDLAEALRREAAPGTAVLVDCLTLW
ncbi:bifunctional adenosylcobinamide kinase/adenosylcobinamide-phosphate guanylyltransferase, partial [Lichenihabitans sp. Uapishka_5]|uniref:bifunctional adenosylcobinamide kinase/adenosylcobinamide-phosphate guanylyltransferase n=1 Tax=Lichenihabitans sp. Uapishka_5 TaxID=3037302 RepID=UPI0029E81D76